MGSNGRDLYQFFFQTAFLFQIHAMFHHETNVGDIVNYRHLSVDGPSSISVTYLWFPPKEAP